MEFFTCVRCQASIDADTAVCFVCLNRDSHKSTNASFFWVAGGVSLFILGLFFQIRNWDKHALEIIPIQIQSSVGSLSATDLNERAAICLDRHYFDCAEQDYLLLAQMTHDPQDILRLGKFQMARTHYKEAAQTYQYYFSSGGSDLDARYRYAQVLTQIGNLEEAAKNYDQVINAKPDVLQITVIKNYVKTLFAANQGDHAFAIIKNVRSKSQSQPQFMEQEWLAYRGKAQGQRVPASL